MALTLWSSGLWVAGLIPRAPTSPYYYWVASIPEGVFGMLAGIWQRWDVIHYTRIATSGYSAPELTCACRCASDGNLVAAARRECLDRLSFQPVDLPA